MKSLTRKLYAPALFDVLFAGAGLVSLGGLAASAGHASPAIVAAAEPLAKGATLVGVVCAAVLLAAQTARVDQKLADDFLFHTLTKSAFIGMFGAIFTAALWEAVTDGGLGSLSSYTMLGVAVASWSLSYFYTRLRGTGA
jgi:hypothetical protein